MNLFPWFLFVHILGAIIAFGASFSAFPLLGAMSGKEPAHANFGSRVSVAVSERIVRPMAILQGLTGLGLIWTASIDLTKTLWLDVAIVLYLIALGYALFVQIPVGRRLVELTSGGPPPAPPAGSGVPAAPVGPPPELLTAAGKARQGGMILAILITVIVFLMVVKPF
ncbi:MAG TPA: DUF2269 family protein [Patescibacteria group bacterium]|nr:DUF2269 family protein [Patescibacteria group bacterium]